MPGCGSYEPLLIACISVVTMWDDGGADSSGFDWEDDSLVTCIECGHKATIADFKIESEGE